MAASEPGSSPIESIQPSDVRDWRRVERDPKSERIRRIELAAIHLAAAHRRNDSQQAAAAIEAMLDEGLKLSEVLRRFEGERGAGGSCSVDGQILDDML